MNLFQILVLGLLTAILAFEFVLLSRRPTRFNLLRIAVWLAIAVAVADPSLIQRFAQAIGIGRGADVVLYGFVLLFVAACFFFYARYLRLQEQITELVRIIAVDHAQRGGDCRS